MICLFGYRAWTDFNLESDSEARCSRPGKWPTIVEKLADFVHLLLNITNSVFSP